jgi:hypothetical protein
VLIDDDLKQSGVKTKLFPKRQIITLMNAMRDRVKDTFKYTIDSTVVLSLENKDKNHADSTPIRIEKSIAGDSNILKIFMALIPSRIPLKVTEITEAYQQRLKQELLPVPFRVSFADKAGRG